MKNLILYIEACNNTLPNIVHKYMTREIGEAPPLYMINRVLERIKKDVENLLVDYEEHS